MPNRSTSKPRSATWSKYWSPKVVTEVNDQYLKIAKVRGHLKIEYEGGRVVDLQAGSMHVVPRGTLRNPVADSGCWIVLIEPVRMKHTGDVESPLTRIIDEQMC
ncbi:mannose-6-phosphate isomerase-like protein (cupin superfamily) [Paraburkholderia sp. RAU6.4a]